MFKSFASHMWLVRGLLLISAAALITCTAFGDGSGYVQSCTDGGGLPANSNGGVVTTANGGSVYTYSCGGSASGGICSFKSTLHNDSTGCDSGNTNCGCVQHGTALDVSCQCENAPKT